MSTVRLTRSETDKKIAGVCGGLANYLDLDPVLVRLAFVVLTLASGVGILLYIILAIITPKESIADEIHLNPQLDVYPDSKLIKAKEKRRRTVFAGLMVFTGSMFLMGNFGINFSVMMPAILILVGVSLIMNQKQKY